MNKYPTLVIGIPAYNEQENIKNLLDDLAKQDYAGVALKQIIIASDGSTDQTAEIVRSYPNPKIKLIDNSDRRGVAARQNQIIDRTSTDVLVLLDADIRIKDPKFIEKMITPIINGQADLTSSALQELPSPGLLGSALITSMKIKTHLFESWKNGNNGYLCHGPTRAFCKKLYQTTKFIVNDGEDMYSYLVCIKNNFRFQYVRSAVALYQVPSTLKDHLKQSIRFFKYHSDFSAFFEKDLIARELRIPISAYLSGAVKSVPIVIHRLHHVILYVLLVILIKVLVLIHVGPLDLWGASSTKVKTV